MFRTWSSGLPPGLEVCAVELPGRETRFSEPTHTRLDALVPAIFDGLGDVFERPFGLFGHSMGALIAFELARLLRRRGAPAPRLLCVAGHRAPQLPRCAPPIHALPEDEFAARLSEINGTSDEFWRETELRELFTPILRADLELAETYSYTPEAPLDCPVLALGGSEDGTLTSTELAAWRAQTSAPFRCRMLPGDHFFVRGAKAEIQRELADELAAYLVGP